MSYTRLNQSHNASNAIDDRPALHFGKTQSPTSLYVDSGEGVYLVWLCIGSHGSETHQPPPTRGETKLTHQPSSVSMIMHPVDSPPCQLTSWRPAYKAQWYLVYCVLAMFG